MPVPVLPAPAPRPAAASPVDSILDKESYSLEELLDEDELIQECKSLNARLTAYLKQKDTVQQLVGADRGVATACRASVWAGRLRRADGRRVLQCPPATPARPAGALPG